MIFRTGLGYDLHKLEIGKKFVLGGIEIPFEKGEAAHSDGDVLLHAVTDALLGASGKGDIGELFPPNDRQWENADSRKLLSIAAQKVISAGWHIENIDCVVITEKPKILPYRDKIIASIANVLKIEPSQIFVKAKTGEGLGIIGSGAAIAALVTTLISRQAQE